MQVFKAYFKIIKKNILSMTIYLFIFLLFAVLLTSSGGDKTSVGFSETKSKIAFINMDTHSPLVIGLQNYLSKNAVIVPITNNAQSLQDALFFRQVEYIVKIPKGFSKSFLDGKYNILIEKTTVPASISGVHMDSLINRYLHTAELYIKNVPDITDTQLVDYIDKDLGLKTKVTVNSYDTASRPSNAYNYFTFLAYTLMAIMILGVTSIMMVFNDVDLRKRNLCSPLKPNNMNLQLLLGNLAFAFVVWVFLIGISLLIYRKELLTWNFIWVGTNSLIFTFVCLSISFLIGNLITSRSAQSAIANVLSLGLCFFSGVFVPQELLGKTTQTIASFTPTYWYVKAINDLKSLAVLDSANLKPVICSMLIQMGFAVAILAISLVLAKQKRISSR